MALSEESAQRPDDILEYYVVVFLFMGTILGKTMEAMEAIESKVEDCEIMSDKLPNGRKNNSRYVGWKAQDILDHKKALKKKWAEDNVEKMRIYRKAHYEKHRDKILHRKRGGTEVPLTPPNSLCTLSSESVAEGEPSSELVTCTLDIPIFSAAAEVELGDSKRSEYKEEKSDSYGIGLNINRKRKTDPSDAFTIAFRGGKRVRWSTNAEDGDDDDESY